MNSIVVRTGIVSPFVIYDSGDPGAAPIPAPGGTDPLDPFGGAIA
ncbi:MAG TPA: hypothetical protein VEX86_01685 [Longimicrobium sp.]|nr:hypothetical protein [Longimicrobium sp.]